MHQWKIKRLSPKKAPVDESQLKSLLERYPNYPLAGYAEYMCEFGLGDYEDFLYVLPPDGVLEVTGRDLRDTAELIEKHYPNSILTAKEVCDCLLLAVSHDGDYVAAHPEHVDRLFVFPRHDDPVYWTDSSMIAPLLWKRANVEQIRLQHTPYFITHADRGWFEFSVSAHSTEADDFANTWFDRWRTGGEPSPEQFSGGEIGYLERIYGKYQVLLQPPWMHVRLNYDTQFWLDIRLIVQSMGDPGYQRGSHI